MTWPELGKLAAGGPTTSAFIERHGRESEGQAFHAWVPYEAISDSLKQAVLVAEDIDFFGHQGFAIDEMKIAVRETLEMGRGLR